MQLNGRDGMIRSVMMGRKAGKTLMAKRIKSKPKKRTKGGLLVVRKRGKTSKTWTKREVQAKIRALGDVPDQVKKDLVCSLVGHSNIVTLYFGEVCCSRCGRRIGDTLASVFDLRPCVIVDHDCERCHMNYGGMGWKDTWLAMNPFPK